MKTDIFLEAMLKRKKLQFLYGLDEVTLDPYYISTNKDGKKVIYGRVNNSPIIRMFEFEKIANIKILPHTKFTPIIPIYYSLN